MSARDNIISRVRAATEALPERAKLPEVSEVAVHQPLLVPDSENLDTLIAIFRERWIAASGIIVEGVDELIALLENEDAGIGYVDPAVLKLLGLSDLCGARTEFLREEVDSYGFGITLASMAIAETGTIVLNDRETSNRLAALAPWVHVAVLKKTDVVASQAAAIAALDNDPSIIFVTGPSKTADIEGILIEGVHGPGRQLCLLV